MVQTKEIMTLAVEIGDIMLRSGAELYRVEDSLIRILEAYGIEDFDSKRCWQRVKSICACPMMRIF